MLVVYLERVSDVVVVSHFSDVFVFGAFAEGQRKVLVSLLPVVIRTHRVHPQDHVFILLVFMVLFAPQNRSPKPNPQKQQNHLFRKTLFLIQKYFSS